MEAWVFRLLPHGSTCYSVLHDLFIIHTFGVMIDAPVVSPETVPSPSTTNAIEITKLTNLDSPGLLLRIFKET